MARSSSARGSDREGDRVTLDQIRQGVSELTQLRHLHEVEQLTSETIRAQVAFQRGLGMSWRFIGDQLGLTAQGAQQRFGSKR